MLTLFGAPIGGGIVIGRACVVDSRMIDVPRRHIRLEQIGGEQSRISGAAAAARSELEQVALHLPADAPGEARMLLEVHTMLLADPSLIDGACEKVATDLVNAEWAVADTAEELAAQFAEIEDDYLRERSRDVEHVAQRLLKALAGSRSAVLERGEAASEPMIFVADDIQPADLMQLRDALGFVIEQGGTNSHTAIIARGMDIPTVLGVRGASRIIHDDDLLILDGPGGVVMVAPDALVLNEYRARQREAEIESQKLLRLIGVPTRTLDDHPIRLYVNIEQPEEAEAAVGMGADGVGLFRSEFLFLNRPTIPTEDEQYEAYASVVTAMRGRVVTIRTIDVGHDKALPDQQEHLLGTSPLGQRAIRFSLAEPELFLTQLRAILRASVHGPVRILLPMLSHVHEIDASRLMIARARSQLHALGVVVPPSIPVGGMIEVPAAAMAARAFSARLDFLSIGTNDLIQYTLAIDRTDERVAHLYDPFHPAVLRLIAWTIRNAQQAGKPVSVCGEMAGDLTSCRLLLGMGLEDFSMHPSSLLRIKREVLGAARGALISQVQALLELDEPQEVREAIAALTPLLPDPTRGHPVEESPP